MSLDVTSLSQTDRLAFASAFDLLALEDQQQQWRTDFTAWCGQRANRFVWSKQREIAEALKVHKRVAVPSCHASGKTAFAAMQIGHWIDTHPVKDTMVISTAPSYEQVHSLLWEEIRQLASEAGLPGEVLQSDRWMAYDGSLRRQVGLGRKPANYARAQFQGWHREFTLVVADEGDGLPASYFDDFEYITTGDDCRILVIGNPTDATSQFAAICSGRVPGWHVITIPATATPNLTGEDVPDRLKRLLVTVDWVEDKKLRWGEKSPLYKARVMAEFPEDGDNLIPLAWVKAANQRWLDWFETWDGYGTPDPETCAQNLWRGGSQEPPGARLISVDVATDGEDATAIATKQGPVILGVERHVGADIPEIIDMTKTRLTHPAATAVVDAVGEGAGVYQVMRHDYPITAFKGSYGTKARDSGGTLKMPNLRVAAFYHLRELLNPALGATLALPPDDYLTRDLTSIQSDMKRTGGYLWIESKDEVRKRLKRSTDAGDAVAMACWQDTVGLPDHPSGQDRKTVAPRRRVRQYANSVSWD